MIERIQKATASSPEGARGLIKGVLACALQNVSFMLPTGLLYFLVKDLMEGTTAGRTAFYVIGCVVCFAFILLTTWFQYNGTYFTTYKESGIRRLTLAERLRKLPLSFFGKRDLADLTEHDHGRLRGAGKDLLTLHSRPVRFAYLDSAYSAWPLRI